MPDLSAMRDKMFQKADANGDSALSVQEFQQAGSKIPMGKELSADKAKEIFGKADSDGNGSLSKDEMRALGDRMSSEMQGAMVNLQAMMGGGSGGMPDPMAMFGNADEDQDGKVSRSEFGKVRQDASVDGMKGAGGSDNPFAAIDSDGDGSLTQAELESFGTRLKQSHAGLAAEQAPAEFQQALSAYRQGSRNQTDLTSVLLKALDGRTGVNA